jgi:hypothetical protein
MNIHTNRKKNYYLTQGSYPSGMCTIRTEFQFIANYSPSRYNTVSYTIDNKICYNAMNNYWKCFVISFTEQ